MLTRIITILLFISVHSAYGQVDDDTNQNDSNTTVIQQDTGRDSTTIVSNAFFDIFYGKPGRAALYGLLVPGGGQIYNKKWWKLPFVYAVEGGTIYWIVLSTGQYNGFQGAYIKNLIKPGSDTTQGTSDVGILRTNRNKWRKQREYSWIIFIGGHLITIFEAFIDRHLMEFDVTDDLTFEPVPSPLGITPGLTYTLALNKKKNIVYKDFFGE